MLWMLNFTGTTLLIYQSHTAQSRPLSPPFCSCHNAPAQGYSLLELIILYISISVFHLGLLFESLLAYVHLYIAREQAKGSLQFEEKIGRRLFFTFVAGSGALSAALPSLGKTKKQNPFDERRLLEQNKRIQRENNVPDDFPSFLREGFFFS